MRFVPVRTRARRDGWTPHIQCAFLAHLYLTGSVAGAVHAVGRSRASAYGLRERDGAGSFRAAWDRVLGCNWADAAQRHRPATVLDWRKLTLSELIWRVEIGFWRPIIHRGHMTAIERKPDNSALLHLLKRMDQPRFRMPEEPL